MLIFLLLFNFETVRLLKVAKLRKAKEKNEALGVELKSLFEEAVKHTAKVGGSSCCFLVLSTHQQPSY